MQGTKGVNILVHGEADSLLTDRRFAVRSWEVSQVNEMLTWMESLSILRPSAGSCSRWPLDFLRPAQVEAAFQRSSLCRRLQQVSSR